MDNEILIIITISYFQGNIVQIVKINYCKQRLKVLIFERC